MKASSASSRALAIPHWSAHAERDRETVEAIDESALRTLENYPEEGERRSQRHRSAGRLHHHASQDPSAAYA